MDTRKNNVRKFYYIIRDAKKIHKYDLLDALHVSESTYEKLKPYVEYRFGDDIFYEKTTKCWIWARDEDTSDKDTQ